jgi:protein SERAC1
VPIVFLAHSLGGLVVKQALLYLSKQSQMHEEIRETFQSVYTILFFGVPCKGLDGERLGLAAMAKGQSTEGFLSDLRDNSPMVDDLAESFLNVFDSRTWVEIYSFHETVASRTAVMVNFQYTMEYN